MEGSLPFQISWASLIVGTKFTVFALYVTSGNFLSTCSLGACKWRVI